MTSERGRRARRRRRRLASSARGLGAVRTVAFDAAASFVDDRAMRLSAALAFYAALSLAPLLVIAVAVAGAVWDSAEAQAELVGQLSGVIGPEAAETIRLAIRRTAVGGTGWAAAAGVVALVFAATIAFAQLQEALNAIYIGEDESDRGVVEFVRKRLVSLVLIASIGAVAAGSLAVSAALGFVGDGGLGALPGPDIAWAALNALGSVVLFAVGFAFVYRVLPDARVRWKDAFVGGAVSGVLFAVGKELIALYMSRAAVGSAFGAASSLMVILMWVYYSSFILFLGAEVVKAYARYGGREIARAKGGLSARVSRRLTQLRARVRPASVEPDADAAPPGCADLWRGCVTHPFARDLARGDLEPEVFVYTIARERRIVREVAERAELDKASGETLRGVAAAIRVALSVEDGLQAGYLDAFSTPAAPVEDRELGPATVAYIRRAQASLDAHGPRGASAVLVARLAIYSSLARSLRSLGDPDPLYETWLATYGGERVAASIAPRALIESVTRETLRSTVELWDEALSRAAA